MCAGMQAGGVGPSASISGQTPQLAALPLDAPASRDWARGKPALSRQLVQLLPLADADPRIGIGG